MILNWFSFGSRAHFSHCQHCSMRQVAFLTFHNWFFRSLGSAWWKKGVLAWEGPNVQVKYGQSPKGEDKTVAQLGTTRYDYDDMLNYSDQSLYLLPLSAVLRARPEGELRWTLWAIVAQIATISYCIILQNTAKYTERVNRKGEPLIYFDPFLAFAIHLRTVNTLQTTSTYLGKW
jgi:hypothetical protein